MLEVFSRVNSTSNKNDSKVRSQGGNITVGNLQQDNIKPSFIDPGLGFQRPQNKLLSVASTRENRSISIPHNY